MSGKLLSIEGFRAAGQIHMAAVLEKLAEWVDADPADVNTSPDWYMRHEWTEKEQKEFEEWMSAYLKNDRKAFYEFIPRYNRFTLKNAKLAAHEFATWYGWKTKLERHY